MSLSFSKRKQGGLGSHPRNPCILPTILSKTQCAEVLSLTALIFATFLLESRKWGDASPWHGVNIQCQAHSHTAPLSAAQAPITMVTVFFCLRKAEENTPDEFRNELWNSIGFLPVIQLPGRKQMPIINHILVDQTWTIYMVMRNLLSLLSIFSCAWCLRMVSQTFTLIFPQSKWRMFLFEFLKQKFGPWWTSQFASLSSSTITASSLSCLSSWTKDTMVMLKGKGKF